MVVVAYLLSSLRRPQRGTGNINLTRLPTVVVVAVALIGDTAVSLAAAAAFPLHFFLVCFRSRCFAVKVVAAAARTSRLASSWSWGSVWFGFFGFSF